MMKIKNNWVKSRWERNEEKKIRDEKR